MTVLEGWGTRIDGGEKGQSRVCQVLAGIATVTCVVFTIIVVRSLPFHSGATPDIFDGFSGF